MTVHDMLGFATVHCLWLRRQFIIITTHIQLLIMMIVILSYLRASSAVRTFSPPWLPSSLFTECLQNLHHALVELTFVQQLSHWIQVEFPYIQNFPYHEHVEHAVKWNDSNMVEYIICQSCCVCNIIIIIITTIVICMCVYAAVATTIFATKRLGNIHIHMYVCIYI